MAQYYYVELNAIIKPGSNRKAGEALHKYITDRTDNYKISFGLKHRLEKEYLVLNLLGCLITIFTGLKQGFDISIGNCEKENDPYKIELSSNFKATYGWQDVMEEGFDALAPFLEDDSKLEIETEDGFSTSVIIGGRVKRTQTERDE